jgi:hypothetical protein
MRCDGRGRYLYFLCFSLTNVPNVCTTLLPSLRHTYTVRNPPLSAMQSVRAMYTCSNDEVVTNALEQESHQRRSRSAILSSTYSTQRANCCLHMQSEQE